MRRSSPSLASFTAATSVLAVGRAPEYRVRNPLVSGKQRVIRAQFSLRTILAIVAACCLLLAWWVPSDGEVRFAYVYFERWEPSMGTLRITTTRQLSDLLGYGPDGLPDWWSQWPDFSKSDVIPVPLNGLAGELAAEFRIQALQEPVSVDYRNTPLWDVVDDLRERCGIDLQLSLHQFASDGVDPYMPITFCAQEAPLRSALHSMLEPHNLTFGICEEFVFITPHRRAPSAYGPSPIDRKDWFDYQQPKLKHRLRLRGKLVFITSFADSVEPDTRAVGYTVPKGAKVLFVTDRGANMLDAGYTVAVILLTVLLAVRLKRRGCDDGFRAN